MGFTILVKCHLYIESTPWSISDCVWYCSEGAYPLCRKDTDRTGITLATTAGGEMCLWDSEVMDWKPRANSRSNSLVININSWGNISSIQNNICFVKIEYQKRFYGRWVWLMNQSSTLIRKKITNLITHIRLKGAILDTVSFLFIYGLHLQSLWSHLGQNKMSAKIAKDPFKCTSFDNK